MSRVSLDIHTYNYLGTVRNKKRLYIYCIH